MHVTADPDIKAPRRAGGVPGVASWELILIDVGMALVRSGEGKGAGQQGRRGSLRAGGVRNVGIHMKTVVALLKDKAGASSTKFALMIGLSSSAVLIVVRIGVAVAGQ
jgi:hypothetical protein